MQNDFLATIKRLSNDYETTMTDTLSTIASDYQRLSIDYGRTTIERLSTIKPI